MQCRFGDRFPGGGDEKGIQATSMTSPILAGNPASSAPTPIPAGRAASLARWNRALVFLHGIQFVGMLAIASTAATFAPYVPTVKPIVVNSRTSVPMEPLATLILLRSSSGMSISPWKG